MDSFQSYCDDCNGEPQPPIVETEFEAHNSEVHKQDLAEDPREVASQMGEIVTARAVVKDVLLSLH
jgi:hypothetical protein